MAGQQPQGSACLCLSRTGSRVFPTVSGIWIWALGDGSHGLLSVANPSAAEPPPRSPACFSFSPHSFSLKKIICRNYLFYFLRMGVWPACVSVCVCVPGDQRGLQRTSAPLELQLQTLVSCHVCAWNGTWVTGRAAARNCSVSPLAPPSLLGSLRLCRLFLDPRTQMILLPQLGTQAPNPQLL